MRHSRRSGRLSVAAFVVSLMLIAPSATAQESFGQLSDSPPVEDRYLLRPLPDVSISVVGGTHTTLLELGQSTPLVLALVFTRCRGICSPLLQSLVAAAQGAPHSDFDYRILVLSFDPRDSLDDMRAMADAFGLASNSGWIFGIAQPADIARLAQAIGFWSRWDGELQQYDHPAILVAIDGGRIVRMLAGAPVSSARFKEIVDELRGTFVAAYPAQDTRVVFRCFRYDAGGNVHFSWGFGLMLLPGALAILATIWTFSRAGVRQSANSGP